MKDAFCWHCRIAPGRTELEERSEIHYTDLSAISFCGHEDLRSIIPPRHFRILLGDTEVAIGFVRRLIRSLKIPHRLIFISTLNANLFQYLLNKFEQTMLQLECTQIIETPGDSMVTARFRLLLNGIPTHQFTSFSLQPDYCEVGDLFSLTAADFEDAPSNSIFRILVDSEN